MRISFCWNNLLGLYFALRMLSAAWAFDDIDPLKNAPSRGFVSQTLATTWEEALISGNGKIGALVMGHPQAERITFSHERLFMPWEESQPVIDMAPHLGRIRKLIDQGEYREAAEFVADLGSKQGYDELRWTDPLVPAFDLKIDMADSSVPRNYFRSVDFQTGVSSIRWEGQDGTYVRRLFVSRPDNVAVLSLRCSTPDSINCCVKLGMTPVDDEEDEEEDSPLAEGLEQIDIRTKGPFLLYRSLFKRRRSDSIAGHEGVIYVTNRGGSLKTTSEHIEIKSADEVLIFVTIDVLDDAESSLVDETSKNLTSLESDFELLLDRHEEIHGEIFNRMCLDLGGTEDHQLSSEQLLEKSKLGSPNAALLEKQFDAARYAILSSSGDLPPTLQGVWTGTWYPPWQSDFTQNGNVPSAIASMLMGNMPECMESYLSYMESLLPHFRENAQKLYGSRGIMVSSRTSAHGYNIHFDEEYCHLFWTPGAAWAAHFFYDYYLYTGNREFLEQRALPFMKEAALFFEDFLKEGPDGRYVFNPSYSPENTPENSDSQASVNATMDIALVRELLTNLISACEELGIDQEGVERWRAMLKKLPAYKINSDGTVAEWTTPLLADNHRHRHISHLYPLYDGLPEDIASSETVRAGFRNVIEKRMEARRRDGGGVMSFGLVQLGQSAASLGEAELAFEAVDMLSKVYWRSNLVSTHNPEEIFNVDICGGMPAVIIKMLVSSQPGGIDLLPALPPQWPEGSIKGVLCRGQIEVESLAWDGLKVEVELHSPIKQSIELNVRDGIRSITVEDSSDSNDVLLKEDGVAAVHLPAGTSVRITIIRNHGPTNNLGVRSP